MIGELAETDSVVNEAVKGELAEPTEKLALFYINGTLQLISYYIYEYRILSVVLSFCFYLECSKFSSLDY